MARAKVVTVATETEVEDWGHAASWLADVERDRSPHYEKHRVDFIRTAENLAKKAKEKNMDEAALA